MEMIAEFIRNDPGTATYVGALALMGVCWFTKDLI